jgi:hypothetical protein
MLAVVLVLDTVLVLLKVAEMLVAVAVQAVQLMRVQVMVTMEQTD